MEDNKIKEMPIVTVEQVSRFRSAALDEIAALKKELQALREQEPSAWIYPSVVEKFKTGETFAAVFSVKVGCPDEESIPLYAAPMPAREGWKLVPSIPTEEMQAAAEKAGYWANTEAVWVIDPSDAYKAMLEAAPKEQS